MGRRAVERRRLTTTGRNWQREVGAAASAPTNERNAAERPPSGGRRLKAIGRPVIHAITALGPVYDYIRKTEGGFDGTIGAPFLAFYTYASLLSRNVKDSAQLINRIKEGEGKASPLFSSLACRTYPNLMGISGLGNSDAENYALFLPTQDTEDVLWQNRLALHKYVSGGNDRPTRLAETAGEPAERDPRSVGRLVLATCPATDANAYILQNIKRGLSSHSLLPDELTLGPLREQPDYT